MANVSPRMSGPLIIKGCALTVFFVGVVFLLAGNPTKLDEKHTESSMPALTIVALSDTHGLHLRKDLLQVPPGDMLMFVGKRPQNLASNFFFN